MKKELKKGESYRIGFQQGRKETICPKCNLAYSTHTCYFALCSGCKDGHSSFHRTIIRTPEWSAWEKEVSRRMNKHIRNKSKVFTGCWDVDECREAGWISEGHIKDFLKFVRIKYGK